MFLVDKAVTRRSGGTFSFWLARLLAVAGLMAAAPAHAITQCDVYISAMWSGSDSVWIFYTNGGSAIIPNADPNKASTIALAMTALAGGRKATVRYSTDSVVCTSTSRTDFVGLYMY